MMLTLYFASIVLTGAVVHPPQASLLVTNQAFDLSSAVSKANDGDTISVPSGTYSNMVFNLNKNRVTLKAATAGGVYISGTSKIKITGNYNTLDGFQFIDGTTANQAPLITVSGNYNTVSNCNFKGFKANKYVYISDDSTSYYNKVTRCNFEGKPIYNSVTCKSNKAADSADWLCGPSIHVMVNKNVIGYHSITYNSFLNMAGAGSDNGNEPIRIGVGEVSTYASRTIVEHNYWYNTQLGDSESISLKSAQNVIRYNTYQGLSNAWGVVFRCGNMNMAYGNYFLGGSGGVRVKQANDSYVFNNYFGGSSSPVVIDYYADSGETRMSNIKIIHNTFVDSPSIDLQYATIPSGVGSILFANNFFANTTTTGYAQFMNENSITSWYGNVYSSGRTLGISSSKIASGFTSTSSTSLKYNATTGVYEISSSDSPSASDSWSLSS